jgi:acyl dehydratase
VASDVTEDETDAFRASLEEEFVGKPMSASGRSVAPDPVNIPMIRHWVDAMDDRNPVYLDEAAAVASRFGGIVAPPAMLQTWTFGRPTIQGLAERGGAPSTLGRSVLTVLDDAGFTATRATNSELDFERYLRPGDLIDATTLLESISDRKTTALGTGYFVTWETTYCDQHGEVVGRQRFRVLKFRANAPVAS